MAFAVMVRETRRHLRPGMKLGASLRSLTPAFRKFLLDVDAAANQEVRVGP